MSQSDAVAQVESRSRWSLRRLFHWLLAILALIILYYAVGTWWFYRIGDDPAFGPAVPTVDGSHTVDMAAALIERETITHHWQPPDPFFMPNGLLIHPSAFQRGIQAALARFSIELEDQIGRTRGSSIADPDLARARGLINFPPDVWFVDPGQAFLLTITSAQNYRGASRALLAYNRRLAARAAVFDVRTDSLAATLDRIHVDLGSQTALIDQHLRGTGVWPINFDADRLFYQTKGRLYAYHMLLRELKRDFRPIVESNNIDGVWAQLLDTFVEAGQMRPFFVIDGSPHGALFASHLAVQGFYVKRAVLQLKELADVVRN